MSPKVMGVELPPVVPTHSDTPPSIRLRQDLSDTHRRLNDVCEAMARVEGRTEESEAKYRILEAQGRIVIAGLSVVGMLIIAVAGWLVNQQDAADKRAREVAEIVAEKTVLAADRRLDERIKLALDASKRDLMAEIAHRNEIAQHAMTRP